MHPDDAIESDNAVSQLRALCGARHRERQATVQLLKRNISNSAWENIHD